MQVFGHGNIMVVVQFDSITVLSGRKERKKASKEENEYTRGQQSALDPCVRCTLLQMDLLPKCCMCMHEQSRNGLCAPVQAFKGQITWRYSDAIRWYFYHDISMSQNLHSTFFFTNIYKQLIHANTRTFQNRC